MAVFLDVDRSMADAFDDDVVNRWVAKQLELQIKRHIKFGITGRCEVLTVRRQPVQTARREGTSADAEFAALMHGLKNLTWNSSMDATATNFTKDMQA